MKTYTNVQGLSVLVSTATVMGREETMAFPAGDRGNVSYGEMLCVYGEGSHAKALARLKAMSAADTLAALESSFGGEPAYYFGTAIAHLKSRAIIERLAAGEIVTVDVE